MTESTRFFDGNSRLHETLSGLTKRFDELGISYVVIGGMALTAHGYARMTEDIDVLITRSDLKKLHENLVGRGYARVFSGSKNIRDTGTHVTIEFVLTGDFPGSGKRQPIRFPDPTDTEPIKHDGVKYVGLARLVELKLASGMSGGADRGKDLVDVQQLMKIRRLQRDFSGRLHEAAREKYQELWDGVHAIQKKYVRLWRNKFLTLDAKSIDDMIDVLGGAAKELRQMKAAGVTLDRGCGTVDDVAYLVTTDSAVAEKYDMHEESEFFGDQDHQEDEPGGE